MAKDFGSSYEPLELKYFNNLCKVLVARKFINTNEATAKSTSRSSSAGSEKDYLVTVEKPTEWSVQRAHTLVKRLLEDKWLQHDSRMRIELGLRSYLELSNYIQELITQYEEEESDEDEDEVVNEEDGHESSAKKQKVKHSSIRMKSSDVPQLIIY